jgi:hypothetical protein
MTKLVCNEYKIVYHHGQGAIMSMHLEILENIAMEIQQSSGVLTKKGKSYLISESSSGNGLVLVPLASPEVLHKIQLTFKEVTGETGDNASVLDVLDMLYTVSHKHKID